MIRKIVTQCSVEEVTNTKCSLYQYYFNTNIFFSICTGSARAFRFSGYIFMVNEYSCDKIGQKQAKRK